jgi:hypothetical protein
MPAVTIYGVQQLRCQLAHLPPVFVLPGRLLTPSPLDLYCPNPQIEFLEVRLAEVMAYADIPPHMRPALSELAGGSSSAAQGAAAGAALAASLSAAQLGAGVGGGGGGVAGRGLAETVPQLAEAREAVLQVLESLKDLSSALGKALERQHERVHGRRPRMRCFAH